MSYEGKMLEDLRMPSRSEVEQSLLISLFKHAGVIKEFSAAEEIVEEIANFFGLNEEQRDASLETIYRKENRVKKSSLWHRLLFRAADSLAKDGMISRPTQTQLITNKREWMLTEEGFDKALLILNIPSERKNLLLTKSYEVQKIAKKLLEKVRPDNYIPIDTEKKIIRVSKEYALRVRGFRQAVIEAYDYKCAVCGLKIQSPDYLLWEVQAAHIVPHSSMGKDDIWNGLSLCRLHHWAFDVGWFTLLDDYTIEVSSKINSISIEYGKMNDFELIRSLLSDKKKIFLPNKEEVYPHENSLRWHRKNIFLNFD